MQQQEIREDAFFWTLQALRIWHRQPFSLELATRQLAAPYTVAACSAPPKTTASTPLA